MTATRDSKRGTTVGGLAPNVSASEFSQAVVDNGQYSEDEMEKVLNYLVEECSFLVNDKIEEAITNAPPKFKLLYKVLVAQF